VYVSCVGERGRERERERERERKRKRKRERERERDVPKIEGGATPCRSTEVPILSNGRG